MVMTSLADYNQTELGWFGGGRWPKEPQCFFPAADVVNAALGQLRGGRKPAANGATAGQEKGRQPSGS